MEEMNLPTPPESPPRPVEVAPGLDAWPPTEDELPYDDGKPMETPRHRQQMNLLIESLELHWADRDDFYVGGNMFVYYNVEQQKKNDFTGPDFFLVLNVPRREHKSWVIWQEGKGPDVVIELLSDSTADYDLNEKKLIYQDRVRVPEYFCYDPFSFELVGFQLESGKYQPIPPDRNSNLFSQQTGLMLTRAEGEFQGVQSTWLRWAKRNGEILPSAEEKARSTEHQLAIAQREATAAQRRASELEAMLTRYREQFGELPEKVSGKTERKKKPKDRRQKGSK
ncbi:MAG TPA: Uma2 family endonuclease [Blastocatellia bacterium]|nr:Uma2 family endonuclease [Blastocatellia bacterium]